MRCEVSIYICYLIHVSEAGSNHAKIFFAWFLANITFLMSNGFFTINKSLNLAITENSFQIFQNHYICELLSSRLCNESVTLMNEQALKKQFLPLLLGKQKEFPPPTLRYVRFKV